MFGSAGPGVKPSGWRWSACTAACSSTRSTSPSSAGPIQRWPTVSSAAAASSARTSARRMACSPGRRHRARRHVAGAATREPPSGWATTLRANRVQRARRRRWSHARPPRLPTSITSCSRHGMPPPAGREPGPAAPHPPRGRRPADPAVACPLRDNAHFPNSWRL